MSTWWRWTKLSGRWQNIWQGVWKLKSLPLVYTSFIFMSTKVCSIFLWNSKHLPKHIHLTYKKSFITKNQWRKLCTFRVIMAKKATSAYQIDPIYVSEFGCYKIKRKWRIATPDKYLPTKRENRAWCHIVKHTSQAFLLHLH